MYQLCLIKRHYRNYVFVCERKVPGIFVLICFSDALSHFVCRTLVIYVHRSIVEKMKSAKKIKQVVTHLALSRRDVNSQTFRTHRNQIVQKLLVRGATVMHDRPIR